MEDIHLRAHADLGFRMQNALVIEDSPHGDVSRTEQLSLFSYLVSFCDSRIWATRRTPFNVVL
jgi:hypothetical protein